MTVKPPHEAALRQIQAADPGSSTWLSANAGSGKTRVLTDRVARLLLEGTRPENILCLTYTKAAAGEMQNRLFRRLGEWAMLPDAALRAALAAMGGRIGIDLGLARTLFARAIETPGGLKIQTIHAFCAGLLRQFPLEAGVTPAFAEMDETGQTHLMADVFDTLTETDPEGAVSALATMFAGDDIRPLLTELSRRRADLIVPITLDAALALYGAPPGTSDATVLAGIDWDADLHRRLVAALREGSTNDVKAAHRLDGLTAPRRLADLPLLETVFLYGEGAAKAFSAKTGAFPTRATRAALADDLTRLDALMDQVAEARLLRLALAAARRTEALHRFAGVFLPAYAAEKARRGWLDFDDLIEKATALLSEREAAQWVLWRLDGGIDHILVDESQDTSPAQWRVIEALTSEFAAGLGARETMRTLFVVGDRKQSIFSFQGADAEGFERVRSAFADRLRPRGGMQSLELTYSFRSAPAILQVVDRTFDGDPALGLGGPPRHLAYAAAMPGRVDLWPLVPKADLPDPGDWSDPVDRVAETAPSAALAARIADEAARMLSDPTCLLTDRTGASRRVRPGDFLILVRGRTGAADLFPRIIQACKTRGLDVAGADVMKLGEELAVRDLTALLAFVAMDEDDLSLAAALRSPLFGWSENALYRLAHDRGRSSLWQVLRRRDDVPLTQAILRDLRSQADYLRPYDLLERILIRHDGRRRLLARLGPEAEDGIDELLNLALSYERQEIPSLTGFLAWLDRSEITVKRHPEQNANKIRVMTVHGAKGLEAPIVILPDSVREARPSRDHLVLDADRGAHWSGPSPERPQTLAELARRAGERAALERDRLLYVAMTRAQNWLIVCGAGEEPKDRSWYGDVRHGLTTAGAIAHPFAFGDGLRFETGDWSPRTLPATSPLPPPAPTLPDWASRHSPPPTPAAAIRTPSDLGGAKALGGAAGLDEDTAKRQGAQVHRLLEHLPGVPAGDRSRVAAELLAQGDLAAAEADATRLAAEVGRLLDRADLAPLFAADALAEVDLTADLPEIDARIHGAVDRLIVAEDHVLAVDFKTNATVPATPAEVPEGLLRQMGAYHAALGLIFPGRAIRTAILWTRTGTLMELPPELTTPALGRARTSTPKS